AAAAAFPEEKAGRIAPGVGPTDASAVSLRTPAGETRLVYVNPRTGDVTGSLMKDEMFMRRVRDLHGNLMGGWFGSALVELTAGWTFVLTVSGLYLWWPRGTGPSRLWGVWLPRLRAGSRTFWRDLHAVPAFWSAALLIVLLVTGMPWTGVFGGMLKSGMSAAGQSAPEAASRRPPKFESAPPAGRTSLTLTEAAQIAADRGMRAGATVSLPRGPRGTFGFVDRGDDALSNQRFLYLDRYTGETLARADWADVPIGARTLSGGIRLHQGELFGWPNLVLMLFGTLAAVWMSLTAAVMWWRRRPTGSAGLPSRAGQRQVPRAVVIGTFVAGALFPLLGAALVLRWA
ncbi:MAG: PepSY domain-containing protein, partial [Planctomycetota bacterium]